MNGLFLHCGPPGPYYYFENDIAERVRQGQTNYAAILPVNRAVRLFKRRLIAHAPQQALIDPPVFTFDELLLNLYQQVPDARQVISPDMVQAILEKILYDNSGSFPYFMPDKRPSAGLVKKLGSMITELRRFGLDAENFKLKSQEDMASNPLKYGDFLSLLDRLDHYLGDTLIDDAFARHHAARYLTQAILQKTLPESRTIFISGYGLFTPAMYLFIEKASRWTEVRVKLDYVAENEELFAHTKEAFNLLRDMKAQVIIDPSTPFALRLFNQQALSAPKSGSAEKYLIQATRQRQDEVSYIAARIRRLHMEESMELSRIAVTFSDMDHYVPLIRRIFPEYGLPFNLSTGFQLHQSSLVRHFLAIPALIEYGYEADIVIRFMQSELVATFDDFNPKLLRSLIVSGRIRYLAQGWADKVKPARKTSSSPGRSPFEDPEYQITQLTVWMEKLYSFPRSASVQQFRKAYIHLLGESGLLRWYHSIPAGLSERQKEAEFRSYNRFMKQFDRMIWTLQYLYKDNNISLSDFNRHLHSAADDSLYNLNEWPDYGVQIMPRLEIQALPARVLFIGGLVDGVFPRMSTYDIFFRDEPRKKLGLLAAEEFLPQDRFIFYTLLESDAERIILTYPEFEEDRALTPSTFLSDLSEAAPVEWNSNPPEETTLMNRPRLLRTMASHIQVNRFKEAEAAFLPLRALPFADSRAWLKLFHSMEISRRRLYPSDFSIYEGDLQSEKHIRDILRKRFVERVWSVNRLEAYAFCPMAFFFQYILGLDEPEVLEDEMSALERGFALHQILQKFYSALRAKKQQAFPEAHRELLFSIARQILDELPYRGLFWELDRSVFFGSAHNEGLLEVFAGYDQNQINENGFVPQYFELSFGNTGEGERDPASQSDPVTLAIGDDALRLSGRIDRIDLNNHGEALIFDYKTGRGDGLPGVTDIARGLSFQLPLYILALMQLQPGITPVMAAYYQVRDADNCKQYPAMAYNDRPDLKAGNAGLPNSKLIKPDGSLFTFESLAEHALQNALRKTVQLQEGYFGHTLYPDDQHCESYCPYRRMCQKNRAKLLSKRNEILSLTTGEAGSDEDD